MRHLSVRVRLIAIGLVACAGALIVGIDDNLPGIALLYGGFICWVLAAVCRWQRPRSFLLLLGLSILGFFVFAILHNLLYAIGESTTIAWIRSTAEAIHVAAFLVALLLCPAGIVVGLVGWLATSYRSWRESRLPAG